MSYIERKNWYKQLEEELNTKILVYVTGDKLNYETQIGQDVIDYFIEHLDKIGAVSKISLYLYTRGGDTAAAWNISNLLRQFCDKLEVIVPHKAHSAGTLISIGANDIIMTNQATLSPIDPSLNTPLNPVFQIPNLPNGKRTYPVSVEAVKGYLAFCKDEFQIKDDNALANVFLKLSEYVHPLVLGQVYRSRAQIKMLAEKLLVNQIEDKDKLKRIIGFLCSDSGSHDYTINRKEAARNLGLNVIQPTVHQYSIIKAIYDDISKELGLGTPFHIDMIDMKGSNSAPYTIKRVLLESLPGGCYHFDSDGVITAEDKDGQRVFQDRRVFDGWKYDKN